MAVSQASRLLWIIGAAFVILPHFNVGLLSDYKICGDSECERMLSRVQAIRDHNGKDCRFLSFRQGDTIIIYHKLTGKRDDLWAGSIDKQFGYFPKDAVREEQVYSTVEKVVETQESDFFCMDEFGYPIDSAHLDNDDDESDQKVQIQESETTQNTPNTDDTNVESPLTSADPSTESPVSAQETEEDTNKNFGDAAHGPHEEAQETPATLNEQGGSPSSSWLGSSVTGWFGLGKEEQPGNLAEGEEEDDMKEIQAEDSLASSVTGWLGFGDKGKPEKAKESVKTSEETAHSFTSTMTGWLGFGDEKKIEQDEHKEMDEEKEEPLEKFRSRRMSLDLEGSQLHVEENEETGTLGWLGNGLSNTLGFGQYNQDSGNEAASGGESEEEKEQLASSSWLDVGIGGILGFQKDNDVSDDSTVRDFKETEEDAISQQPAGSQSEDTHQSQSALTDEGKIETSNESEMEEPPKDLNAPSTEAITAGSNDSDLDIPDSSKSSVLQRESEFIDDHRDLSSHTKSEEKSQAGDGMSSMFSSIFQSSDKEDKEDSLEDDSKEKNKTDEEIFVEVEAEHHEMPKSTGNERTDITGEPGEEEFKTQSDSNLDPNHSFVDLKSNSIEQSVDNSDDIKKDQLQSKKTESAQEEGAEITHQAEESTDVSGNIDMSGENHEGESSNEETELPHRETFISQTEESAEESQVSGDVEDNSTQSQLFLSSADERNEPISAEDESFTPQRAGTNDDNSDALAKTDNNVETHTHRSELGHEEETQPVKSSSEEFKSSHFDSTSTESLDENASEEDRGTISSSGSTAHTDQASVSPQMDHRVTQRDGDTDELNETVEETVNDSANNLQQTQTEKETSGAEEEDLNEGDLKSTMDSETQAEEVEESENGGEQETIEGGENEKIEHLKEVEEVKEEEKQEEKQDELEELKEEKNQEEIQMKENEKLEEHAELKGEQQEIKEKEQHKDNEIKDDEKDENSEEEEKQEDVAEVHGEENGDETQVGKEEQKLGEVEEQEEDKQQKIEGLLEEENQASEEELKKEEKQGEMQEVEEVKEKETKESEGQQVQSSHLEEHEELKEEIEEKKLEDSMEEEEHQQTEELKEERVQEDEEEVRLEEQQQQVRDFKEEKKPETLKEVEEINMEEKQEEVKEEQQDIKEQEQHKDKEIKDDEKDENSEEEEKQEDVAEVHGEEKGDETQVGKEERKVGEAEEQEEDKQQKIEGLLEEENQASEEELKKEEKQREMQEVEELKEKETKESEGQQVPSSHLEEQKENIQNNISKSEPESDNKETEDGKDLASSFTETAAKTENPQVEVKEKTEGQEEEEKHQKRDMEEDDLKGSSELCSQPSEEESVAETDGGSSEEGTSSQNGDSDIQMRKNHGHTIGSESWSTGGLELSAPNTDPAQSQAMSPEQTASAVSEDPPGSALPPDDLSRGTADSNTGGALGLFKNTFGFFSQTPTTETKGSTESAQSFNANPGETSQTEASLTPEQEPDSTSDLRGNQDAHIDSSITTSTELPLPYPSSSEIHLHTAAQNAELTLQTKTISKVYKNLLEDMSVDETAILVELFGQYKLQFLDYILVSSEGVAEDLDHDESILSDIERLLHHHREALVAPRMGLADAPQEDKEKTRTLIALQKLEMLLARVRKTFDTGQSDHQAEASCVGASCSTHNKDKEVNTGKESRKIEDSLVAQDNDIHRDGWMELEKDSSHVGGGTGQEMETVDEKRGDKGNKEETVSSPHIQPGSPQPLEVMKQILESVLQMSKDSIVYANAVKELFIWLTVQVVSSLPDDIRPGPDLYGVPWEPVIITGLVGLVTMLLFTCRCYSSIKSRMYRSKERWMAEQVAQLLDEKCKVLETLSQSQQEYDDLESSLRDSGVLAQTQKTEQLEAKARQLEHTKKELDSDLEELKDQLDKQREHKLEQEKRIAELEEKMKTFEEETKDLQSQEDQAQTTLKVYNMNSERLQRNLETAGEENTVLQESNAQLRQQLEGWAERVSELEAEMKRYEVAHSGMLQDVANKDERIMSLTDRLLRMKGWDSDLEEEQGDEAGEKEATNGTAGKGEKNGKLDKSDKQGHLQKVQKLIYAAKLNADLKSIDEDKDRVFAKFNDEVKAKEDLQESIEELENEKLSLQSDTEQYSDQVQRLQQKLQIMTEMYQENELKLHRLLTVEEKERLQKEEKLNKADKNIAMAMEELNNYRQRAEEMEEELEKTKQSYQTQISAHEKKAHNNWLAARGADRELADIRRENALLRQKLTDTQFKLDALDKDPFALNSLARPLPFRAERSPYGPSPLGRPASETRPFLSPPTLMDGPPARLSPRVSRGPGEPPGGQGEMERPAGSHSDSGSISPTWERDRRGPPPGPPGPMGPPGYMFPEPGGPMYRRPPPPPGALGILPPPGSLPPGPLHPRGLPPGPPQPLDMADGSYRENRLGPAELEHRESGPGDRRSPPEAGPRIGGPPPPGPPMGPMDGPFPRRAPYGPLPPPDFYHPRGPGGPPMMPMWAPPPPGMMLPPRFPPGGPPPPPAPHPHMPSYGPPMRPPPPDGLPPSSMGPPPPQQSLPSPPHSQSLEENTPSPEDAI